MLARMHPNTPTLQVSHETIYTALYTMPRGELDCLPAPESRKSRRPRARGTDRRGTIPNMTSIHDRPSEVEERFVLGYGEGDPIKGARNAFAIGTLVERTTLSASLSILPTDTAPGNAASTRTPTDSFDSTSPRKPT